MLSESISEIGLMIQGHLQGQISWSMSCKLAKAMSLKSATVGFTKSKCLFGLSLNDVVSINFKVDLGSKIIFTRGQFWPSGIVIACVCGSVCPCVCVCVYQSLACPHDTHRPFKLGSPNLDQRCKTPWFRSLFLGGWSTLIFKVKFNLKVKFYLILSLFTVHTITHQPFKLESPN